MCAQCVSYVILCTQNHMEMIVDEVQTGVGSTGHMWLVLCFIFHATCSD